MLFKKVITLGDVIVIISISSNSKYRKITLKNKILEVSQDLNLTVNI